MVAVVESRAMCTWFMILLRGSGKALRQSPITSEKSVKDQALTEEQGEDIRLDFKICQVLGHIITRSLGHEAYWEYGFREFACIWDIIHGITSVQG